MRDEQAFVEFATAARPRLRRTAYLMCGDWELASDVVQEALIRMYVAWPRLQRKGRESAYARRAVTSAYLDHTRKRSTRERPAEIDDRDAAPGDVATAVTDRAALLQALARLAPRQRACVVLRYFDDLGVAETATALGCSEGTVKSQTARGLATLRTILESAPEGALTTKGVAR